MPVVELDQSPLAPGVPRPRIHVRDEGSGAPIVFLHGGWGYRLYPIDDAAAGRVVIPDRSGYGGSVWIDDLPIDFHARAAVETLALIDVLGLERPVLWGHSDGAVIAALIALDAPARVKGVILEAMHLSGHKPSSQQFFAETARNPDAVGPRAAAVLAGDHGERWRTVVTRHSDVWLRLHRERPAGADFYGGRLSALRAPALVVHGARDPRTEPGELDAIRAQMPDAAWHVLPDGAHSPHSEPRTTKTVHALVREFLK